MFSLGVTLWTFLHEPRNTLGCPSLPKHPSDLVSITSPCICVWGGLGLGLWVWWPRGKKTEQSYYSIWGKPYTISHHCLLRQFLRNIGTNFHIFLAVIVLTIPLELALWSLQIPTQNKRCEVHRRWDFKNATQIGCHSLITQNMSKQAGNLSQCVADVCCIEAAFKKHIVALGGVFFG